MAKAGPTTDSDLSRSLLMGLEVEYDYTCHPCSAGGRNVEADGHCHECAVYLCGQCINYHRVLPATAHHQLTDKHNMPQTEGTAKDACTKRCDTHKEEVIKYYCPVHKRLGCTACITLQHKLCKDVVYIPEAAVGLEDSEDFKTFQKKLEALIQTSKNAIKLSQDSLKRSTDNYTRVLQEVETYQQEITTKLEKLKTDIEGKLDKIKAENTGKMNTATTEGQDVLAELAAMSKDIQNHLSKKHYNKLFVQMKTKEEKLTQLEERLKEGKKTSASLYEFKKNLELQKMMDRKSAFGELVRQPEMTNVSHVMDINVKTDSDKETCGILGSVLLSTSLLVVTDFENETVKLLDIDNCRILSELGLNTKPWDVTKVGNEHVAVTEPLVKKIAFLKYDERTGLVVDKEIKTISMCYGIAFMRDKLVVSFSDSSEVKMLNMNGDVLHTFATDGGRKWLFNRPGHVAVNTSTQVIYVLDLEQDSVTMLDMSGNVKTVYEDDEMEMPKGIVVDHMGRVYVCGEESNNIHLLTGDCQKVKVLLHRDARLRYPVSLSYCEETRRLYVVMEGNDVIKVFQLF